MRDRHSCRSLFTNLKGVSFFFRIAAVKTPAAWSGTSHARYKKGIPTFTLILPDGVPNRSSFYDEQFEAYLQIFLTASNSARRLKMSRKNLWAGRSKLFDRFAHKEQVVQANEGLEKHANSTIQHHSSFRETVNQKRGDSTPAQSPSCDPRSPVDRKTAKMLHCNNKAVFIGEGYMWYVYS
ncbi:MAG: hypothetical protein LBO79_06030 [Zoogloeaceae bacterium]|jgi:hypothetical protein|nr:hypothetical protein [Zoogloeaceae bacterium]